MQSPAPQKQKIAGRSDSSEDTKEEAFDIIENIEAVTEEDKKEEAESDSSDSTIAEVEEEDDKVLARDRRRFYESSRSFRSFSYSISIRIRLVRSETQCLLEKISLGRTDALSTHRLF
jgi:hypothetical protein